MGAGAVMGMMVAGTTMQAIGSYQSGRVAEAEAKGQQRMAQANAQAALEDAKARKIKGEIDQRHSLERMKRARATLRARQGTTGAHFDPLLEEELVAEFDYERALIGYSAMSDADRLEWQAGMHGAEAEMYGEQGKYAKRTGTWNAISDVIGGATDIYSMDLMYGGKKTTTPKTALTGTRLPTGSRTMKGSSRLTAWG